ncbi:unnamed protein product [Ilex paraguariensis]|uniref:Pectinesterase inhibitor domain-containing protein n=1 Tax=Ilex paraguariensis TaxID=185542 RepID=A0ABC8STD5_9AQUA
MARATVLALFLSLIYIAGTAESAAVATNFIKASCRTTQYPAVCVQSLSTYAATIQRSPKQLVQTALSVSLDTAQSMKTFVTRLTKFKGLKKREYAAIKDCLEEMSDNVDRISKSVKELKNMGSTKGPEFQWHMSNVETWVSAALTDENTCTDGFAGKALNGRIQVSIKARVTNLGKVTSNALALVNNYATKH